MVKNSCEDGSESSSSNDLMQAKLNWREQYNRVIKKTEIQTNLIQFFLWTIITTNGKYYGMK